MEGIVACENVSKTYHVGHIRVPALDEVGLGLGDRSTEYGGIYSTELESYVVPGRTFWFRISRYF